MPAVEVTLATNIFGQADPLYDMEVTGGPLGTTVYVWDRIWLKMGDNSFTGAEHKIHTPGAPVNQT